jgi:CTP synthase
MKYIFITGGVVSSLGKGLTSGALGALLEQRGLTTRIQKFDPYLNVDPGTMSPFSMVRCMCWTMVQRQTWTWVIMSASHQGKLSKFNNLTSGQIYESVIRKERRGDYLGKNSSGYSSCYQRD